MPQNLYKSILLTNSRDSTHHGMMQDCSYSADGKNARCGDELTLFINVNSAGDKIEKITFKANACAICLASSNILAKKMEGQSIVNAKKETERFLDAMRGSFAAEKEDEEMKALLSIRDYPARIRCATLSWETFQKALV